MDKLKKVGVPISDYNLGDDGNDLNNNCDDDLNDGNNDLNGNCDDCGEDGGEDGDWECTRCQCCKGCSEYLGDNNFNLYNRQAVPMIALCWFLFILTGMMLFLGIISLIVMHNMDIGLNGIIIFCIFGFVFLVSLLSVVISCVSSRNRRNEMYENEYTSV